jgi:protein involved in polysaccharide export with SLBB domain
VRKAKFLFSRSRPSGIAPSALGRSAKGKSALRLVVLCGATLLASCGPRIQYDVPTSIAMEPQNFGAAQQANSMIERYMATRGDFHANDLIRLSFPYFPLLDAEQRVQMSGMISPPLLAPIDVRGMSVADLQSKLVALYRPKLERPAVSISVLEYNEPPPKREVFVIGEVQKAGPFLYRDGVSLIEAVSRAGGPTPRADISHVVVLTPVGDVIESRLVDLKSALNGGGATLPYMNPYSIVIVPTSQLARTSDKAELIQSIIGFNGINLGWSFRILE